MLEPLRDEDSDVLFAWINDPELVQLSAVFRPVTRVEHDAWFASAQPLLPAFPMDPETRQVVPA